MSIFEYFTFSDKKINLQATLNFVFLFISECFVSKYKNITIITTFSAKGTNLSLSETTNMYT